MPSLDRGVGSIRTRYPYGKQVNYNRFAAPLGGSLRGTRAMRERGKRGAKGKRLLFDPILARVKFPPCPELGPENSDNLVSCLPWLCVQAIKPAAQRSNPVSIDRARPAQIRQDRQMLGAQGPTPARKATWREATLEGPGHLGVSA